MTPSDPGMARLANGEKDTTGKFWIGHRDRHHGRNALCPAGNSSPVVRGRCACLGLKCSCHDREGRLARSDGLARRVADFHQRLTSFQHQYHGRPGRSQNLPQMSI